MNSRTFATRTLCLGTAFFIALVFSMPSHAFTTSFTAQQLSDFLNAYRKSNDPNKQLLWKDLNKKLAGNGVSLTENGFIISGTQPAVTSDGCSYATTSAFDWNVFLSEAYTQFSLPESSNRMVFEAGLSGIVQIPPVYISYSQGVDLGFLGCIVQGIASYSGTVSGAVSVNGNMKIDLDVSIIDKVGGGKSVVIGNSPLVTGSASGGVTDLNFSGSGGFIESNFKNLIFWLFESKIKGAINKSLSTKMQPKIEEKTANIAAEFPITYDLPNLDPQLIKQLSTALNLPSLQDYIELHAEEILFYLLINDKQALRNALTSPAACAAVTSLRNSSGIKPLPVYTLSGRDCVPANPEGADTGVYFADNTCSSSIDFKPTPFSAWCEEALGVNTSSLVGNAAAWTADASQEPVPGLRSQKWTIAQGTQMPISSESLSGNTTPFMKRVNYRVVQLVTPGPDFPDTLPDISLCQLEMRIYKKDVRATGLTPLMAIHGGSWTYRGAGFSGMEAQISHYTDQGFVVFAPFYRLVGHADGNPECQGATWTDLTADVDSALTWVQQHGAAFGAKPGKISLMGQSAGAHLAGWLVTHRPNDVDKALMLYPPADVRDFLTNINGSYAAFKPSLDLLSGLYGVSTNDLLNVNVGNPPEYVVQNSFADLVRNANGQMPPVFLIHGRADSLVPSNQSVVLCNAYGGNAANNGGGAALRATYNCGPDSRLHMIEQGEHALDVCVTTRLNGMCLAGSEGSRQQMASSMQQARYWLQGNEFPWLVPVNALLLN